MGKLLQKMLLSRPVGFVLVAAFAFSAITLVRSWLPRAPRPSESPLVSVLAPNLDRMEKLSRLHVEEMQARCDPIIAAPDTSPKQRSKAYGELGKIYLIYHLEEAATACLTNAARLDADEFRWWYLLAHAQDMDGKPQEAAAAMARALQAMEADPTARPPDRHASYCFLGTMALQLDKRDEARAMFESALALNPRGAFALFQLGQVAIQTGEPSKACAYFQRAAAERPYRVDIRRAWAMALRQAGDAAKAAEVDASQEATGKEGRLVYADPLYAEVQTLNRSAALMDRLAGQYFDRGEFRQAEAYQARAVAADPEMANFHSNHASTLLMLGRDAEALKELEAARRLDATMEEPRMMLCVLYAARPATAAQGLADARAWCAEKPKEVKPRLVLAEVYVHMGRYEDACHAYEQAAALAPESPEPYVGRAKMLAALGRHGEARDLLEKTQLLFPGSVECPVTLARLLTTCPDATVRDGARGLQLSERLFKAQNTVVRADLLAVALAEVNRFPEAIERERRAIEQFRDQGAAKLGIRLKQTLQSLEAHKPWREIYPFCPPAEGPVDQRVGSRERK
jgi:tetratricopeptide (TPR) repeat protein